MKAMHWMSAALLAAIAIVSLGLSVDTATASNEIAKKEGLACTSCHDKPGSRLLTDRGKYYEVFASLEGLNELETAFGRCTSCHARKPGSLKLTRLGKRYQELAYDMAGLKEILMAPHPSVSTEEDEEEPE